MSLLNPAILCPILIGRAAAFDEIDRAFRPGYLDRRGRCAVHPCRR